MCEIDWEDTESLRHKDYPGWRVACVLNSGEREFHKVITWHDGTGGFISNDAFTEDGRCYVHNSVVIYNVKPEIVEYVNVYPGCFGGAHTSIARALSAASFAAIGVIKLTFNPNTREAKAEVVE
jgi:hypothetical protein